MNRFFFTVMVFGSIVFPLQAQNAVAIIDRATRAFGDWSKVEALEIHFIGHTHWLEQSENPNGPFITSYEDVTEVRAIRQAKLYQNVEMKTVQNPGATNAQLVIDGSQGIGKWGGRAFAMPKSMKVQQQNWLTYGPERLLQIARNAAVKDERQQKLEGVLHDVVSFSDNAMTYRLFINNRTGLISEAHIETFLPNEFFFSIWGKFTTRIQYSLYELSHGNILYPLQWDVWRLDRPWKKITINSFKTLGNLPDSLFKVDQSELSNTFPEVAANETPLKVDQLIEVAKGIYTIPGNWFTGWVEQNDGIVVMEAPIASGFSAQLIKEVQRRYPDKKIKCVISTSDAWPHLGGAREYFANSIPVYTNHLNKEICERLAAADFSIAPDAYQRSHQKPQLKLVDKPTVLVDAERPISIYPIEGEGGERMLAVYFPQQKVLYASDLIQQTRPGEFFFPEYLLEVQNLVDRHHLAVETVYAMHTRPLPYQQIVHYLNKLK